MNRYLPMRPPHPSAGRGTGPVELARIGAVVGLCGAGAKNLRQLRHAALTPEEAVAATLKAGMAAGLASGAAGLAAGLFRSPLLALLATVATGTTVMYVLNPDPPETSDAP